ncbi:MAG: presqualene diphosphate synthase HpnD [Elusimicrobia bacterium]|nr:presqualene diphosphate synthase HpnD [Elusimicrobiota bacterium]
MSSPESGSNFSLSFFFLPRAKRQALSAVYAFCRHVDDIVDGQESSSEKFKMKGAREALQFWKTEIEQLYAGKPTHPIAQSLMPAVEKFKLPKESFLHIVEGVEMDLTVSRYKTFQDLEQYIFRVASSVGFLCIGIFGYQHPSAREYALNLGYAFQLTNIMRDVGSDLDRDRIYLPLEDLDRFGYSEKELRDRRYTPWFVELMKFEYHRTKSYYQKARGFLSPVDRRNMRPAEVMAVIYEALLEKIKRGGFDVFQEKISLNGWEKASQVLRVFV